MKKISLLAFSTFTILGYSLQASAQNTVVNNGSGDYMANQSGAYTDFTPPGDFSRLNASNGAQITIIAPTTITGKGASTNGNNAWNPLIANGAGTKVTVDGNLTINHAPSAGFTYDKASNGMMIQSGAEVILNGDTTITGGAGYESRLGKSSIYNTGGKLDINGNMNLNIGGSIFASGHKGINANNNATVDMKSTTTDKYLLTVNNNGSQRSIDAASGAVVNLDLVKFEGLSTSSNGTGMYAQGSGTSINFMGGSFNTNYKSRPGATGLWSQNQAIINVTGYEGGSLTANSSGNYEKSVWAFGNAAININTEKHADFVTNVNTYVSTTSRTGLNGITAGTLGKMVNGKIEDTTDYNPEYDESGNPQTRPLPDDDYNGTAANPDYVADTDGRVGSRLGNSEVNVYGEVHVDTDEASAYGLSVLGDGNKITLANIAGQKRSSIHSKATAIAFSFANEYSLNPDDEAPLHGGQIISVENTDITHDGNNSKLKGDLIQVGGTQPTGRDGQNSGTMMVADVVKNAVLNLKDSTATAIDGRNLLSVNSGTYNGETGTSELTLNADNTVLVGHILTDATPATGTAPIPFNSALAVTGSTSTINLKNGSVWYLHDGDASLNPGMASNVTNLNMDAGTHVYLNSRSLWNTRSPNQPSAYNELNVDTLSGNGTFHFNTDMENQVTDRLIVKNADAAEGSHILAVKNDGAQNTDGTEVLHIVETNGGSAGFNLQNDALVELGAYTYGLRQRPGDENKWELYRVSTSSTADTLDTFVHTNYLLTYLDMQTLIQRMGELRYSKPENNVWVKGITGKLNSFGRELSNGYKMNYDGIQAGIDYTDAEDENPDGQMYGGLMLGLINADQKFRDGNGDADNLHVGVYGGWMEDDGFYTDAVLKYARLKNKFNILDSAGDTVHTSGRTNAYSASIETGKRFKNNDWFIEPQIQGVYTWQDGYSSTASNGLRVHFDDYNSLLLRGSALFGYEFHEKDYYAQVYFKTGYVRELLADDIGYRLNDGAKHKNDFSGGWWENALGVNTRFEENHNIYVEATYRSGNLFDQYQADFGYRYEF